MKNLKLLKEILPYNSRLNMEFNKMLSNLSSDVITNISSYLLGEHKYMKFKYNNALKQIQQKCRPEIEDIRYYNDITTNEYQYENYFYTVNPKYKTLDYGLKLIIRQTEMVKNIIKKSFLSYLQPDMKRYICINVEINVKEDDGEFYTYEMDDSVSIEWQSNNYIIQNSLNRLYQYATNKIDYMYDDEHIEIEWLQFWIEIIIDPDEYK